MAPRATRRGERTQQNDNRGLYRRLPRRVIYLNSVQSRYNQSNNKRVTQFKLAELIFNLNAFTDTDSYARSIKT